MRTALSCSAWVAAAALCSGAGANQQPDRDIVLTLSRSESVLRTGDAVFVSVETSVPFTTLEGEAFGRGVSFWPGASERQWHGLVGIDMEAGAGTYELQVHATSVTRAAEARMPLVVEERRVETRRIRVAQRFANPSREEAARIQQEAERLAKVLGQSEPMRLWRGPFIPPVPGPSTSSFGRLTVMNNVPRGRHRGVDFRASEGTPIRAPNAGTVVLAADLYFTGNTVILDHGAGLVSLLAHLSHIVVDEGMQVSGGDLVGQTGSTGRVTGPHLHWAMRLSDATIDPLSLISALSAAN